MKHPGKTKLINPANLPKQKVYDVTPVSFIILYLFNLNESRDL
jgi:hypothetical protein